jgi:hypothetical protein
VAEETAVNARAVAWTMWCAWALFAAATAALVLFQDGGGDELLGLLIGSYVLVGALIVARQPTHAVGWILALIGLAFTIQGFGEAYVAAPSNPGRAAVAWLIGWIWYVWFSLTVLFLPLVFPDGRLLSRRWRGAVWLAGLAVALSNVGEAFKAGPFDIDGPRLDNPLGVTGAAGEVVAVAAVLGNVLAAVGLVLSATALACRFRRARGAERQQLKWFAYVGLLAVGFLMLAMAVVLAGESPPAWLNLIGAVGWMSALALIVLGIPAATGIAILRHRLYDIDLVINRTLVYAALTATLAATYLGSVLLLQLVLQPVTRDSGLAIAASTLAVAGLFGPARARIQAVVDRRFYRRRYDAARTLEAFSGRLRDELDLDALRLELAEVVGATMQPAHVSLWLRRPS